MKKFAIWLLFATALTPIILAPNLITFEIGGKITLIRGLAFGAILFTFLAMVLGKKNSERTELLNKVSTVAKNPLFVAVIAQAALLLVSAAFAYDRSMAFFGEPFRAEGFLTLFAFTLISFLMALLFEKKQWNLYFIFTWIVSLGIFIIELSQAAGGVDRPEALIGNPIFLASYYLFSIFVSGYLALLWKKAGKPGWAYGALFSILLFVVGIFLTDTRGTIVAIFIALLCTLVLLAKFGVRTCMGTSIRFLAGSTLAVIAVFSGVFLTTRHSSFWQKIPGVDRLATTSLSEGTAASRIKFTQLSINGFFADGGVTRLLFGWGWDNYVYFFQQHYDPMIYHFEEKLTDRAHNKLADMLVMTGLLGFVTYVITWFLLAKRAMGIVRNRLLLGTVTVFFIVAYFINNLFTFDVGVTYLGFYSMIAFIAFTYNENVY